jgi:ribose transport system ATP-binding protein
MPPLLEARGVRKQFPGVLALDGVDLTLDRGEVVAVVGENGAGKSTLMKVLAGVYQPDAGTLRLDGREVRFPTVQSAIEAGVSLIHQELNLAENLSAAANIFLGREKLYAGPLRLLDRAAMRAAAAGLLDRVGLPPSLADATVGNLAPGQKQLIEIARALSFSAKVIIMDEPTSSLTQSETDRLYEVIDDLRRHGVGVAYISHRLAEVKRVADRAVVLRDGRNAGELAKAAINHDNLVRLMVGRELKQLYPRARPAVAAGAVPVLSVRDLRYRGGPPHPVTFDVFPGEVLGMAGLVGAGRTELAEAVFGIRPRTDGEVRIAGRPVTIEEPKHAIRAGIAMVPEDRRFHGLVLPEGGGFNLSLPNLSKLSTAGLVSRRAEAALGRRWVDRLRVKTPSLAQPVGLLSGGNQQKVVFGKWLAREPRLLILDEPTRGVDVGARGEIYAIIDELAAAGLAVWMISSDMEEVLGMSDRVAVLHEGRLAGTLPRDQLSEEAVMRLATGAA